MEDKWFFGKTSVVIVLSIQLFFINKENLKKNVSKKIRY